MFFRKHPARTIHVRRSVPYEFEDWESDGHKRFNFVLTYLDPEIRKFRKRCLSTLASSVPDDEDFLWMINVWTKEHGKSGELLSITPEQCAALLSKCGITS